MTDKKQPEALRLADALERPGYGWHSTPAQCAAELRRQYAEIETLRTGYAAARLEIESLRGRGVEPADEYPALPGRTIDELTESQRESAIAAYRAAHEHDPDFGFAPDRAWVEGAAYVDADRAMRVAQPATADDRAAFKAYLEDCDECAIVPDIAGAFHAGWTSRVRAAQPAGTQRPGDERAAFEQWSEVTNQGYDLARNVSGKLQTFESTETEHAWRGFFHGLRASHGQAPINLNCKSEQKRLATLWGFVPAQAAPTAVAGPSEAVAYLDIGTGGYLDLGTGLTDEALSRLPKGRHALVIAGTYGIDGYTAAPTTQPTTQPAPQQEAQEPVAGQCRFPGAVWSECSPEHVRMVLANPEEWKRYEVRYLYTAPQPSPAAQGDALDAARWRALLACGRIRIIGTAGVTGTGAHDPKALDPNKQPYGNYVHFGAEFWSTFPDQDYYNTKENPAYARATLTEFADAARAAQEGK
jgi:hypothetical protein